MGNYKRIAVFFILMVCGEQVCRAMEAAAVKREAEGVLVRNRRQALTKCTVNPQVTVIVDNVLSRCQKRIRNSYDLRDQVTPNGLMLESGTSSGWKNINRTTPVNALCSPDTIRLYIEISYLRILISYTLNLVDGLLGGLLGGALSGVVSTLTRLLDGVVSLLLSILALDIKVVVIIEQLLIPGAHCQLVRFRVVGITQISILNVDLTVVADLLQSVLAPVLDLVLNIVLSLQIKPIFAQEFGKISIPLNFINF